VKHEKVCRHRRLVQLKDHRRDLPAVKAFASDPERLARFEREARTRPALNHPHIAQIYGFERASGVSALVMELRQKVPIK
jgi:serine/threonine protein kinase